MWRKLCSIETNNKQTNEEVASANEVEVLRKRITELEDLVETKVYDSHHRLKDRIADLEDEVFEGYVDRKQIHNMQQNEDFPVLSLGDENKEADSEEKEGNEERKQWGEWSGHSL